VGLARTSPYENFPSREGQQPVVTRCLMASSSDFGGVGRRDGAVNRGLRDVIIVPVAVIGAVREGLLGPLSGEPGTAEARHGAAQALTLFALRALGVVDARARGLVVQAG
jgi:hypothetical protein